MASHNKGTRIDGAINFHKATTSDGLKCLRGALNPARMSKEDVQAFRDRYRENPVKFCREILGLDLDENQQQIANSVKDHRRTACISARGCGKSVCVSALAIWYFVLAPHTKVILGANTHSQSYSVLWLKTIELIQNSGINQWFEVTQDFIYWKGARDLGYITRITCGADKVESLSGYHAPHMLILLDEASSIPDKIILNLIAGMTELDNRICLTTNPTRNTGFMAEVEDNREWNVIHIDGFSSRFTDKEHLQYLIDRYGEDSDTVRVQVRGLFPKVSSDVLVSKELFLSCETNETPKTGDTVLGLDVASTGGDLSQWCVRRGGDVVFFDDEGTSTVDSLVSKTIRIVEEWGVDRIFVDSTGMGWTIPEILEKNLPNKEVIGVQFAEKPKIQTPCMNNRSWMYVNLRDRMRDGHVSFKKVPHMWTQLKEEMLATQVFLDQTNGKLKLCPKDEIRTILGHSPDLLDSLALTFATEEPWRYDVGNSEEHRHLDEDLMYAGLWG